METKDLVLLMLIPVILISLIVYTDKNSVITGAVTHEPKKDSNIIGTYSINPSFKAKINYNLDDYNEIKQQFDFISSCAQNKNVEFCINDINSENDFAWELGCEKGAEKVLYDFAEFFQNCIDSDDDNCLCRKSMDITKDELQGYLPPTNRYDFALTEYPSLRKIDIELPNFEGLSYSINTNGLSGWTPKTYSLGYNRLYESLEFNLFFPIDLTKIPPDKPPYGFGPTQQIIIYKNQLKSNIKSIDFVNLKDNKLIYPNGELVMDKNNKPIEINNIPNCKIKQKNIYRFCVTKKDFKIIAYDKIDGQVKERPITIKFAAYIPPKTE